MLVIQVLEIISGLRGSYLIAPIDEKYNDLKIADMTMASEDT